ncbi:hypothetical protein EOE67_18040 [Rheinheimera riviphila]|uniref:histidine kinase n=1 Tax=Rheinheimera riviphila TaxID=1834037 RepID=A0A437QFN0_9GAMM|nr:sensor histidine kinase [Rheinheimera riviphila]RVU33139.1 hypothetical protein EOE67_18040 [Rheinheimera riviphila]
MVLLQRFLRTLYSSCCRHMFTFIKGFSCLLFFSMKSAVAAPLPEFGLPPIKVYLAADYQAHRQNWAVTQTADGLIYVGNEGGLLEFDGLRWRLIPLPNNSQVRALAVDPTSGRVYVGAVNEIGYLTPDAAGLLQYQSLLPQLPPDQRAFSSVWHCHANHRGVFFTTSGRLFRFGPDGLKSWPSQQQFVHSVVIGERFFLRDEGVGLLEQAGDMLQLVPDGAVFAEKRISVMVAWPGQDDLLAVSRTLGFMRYNGQKFSRWPTDIDNELLTKAVYSAWPLMDGRLAVGMLQGGMYILDKNGRNVGQLNRQTGLPDNSMFKLMQDREQGLWIATNTGLARAQFGQTFSRFDLTHGLDGSVYSMLRHQGLMYVGTSQGLYRLSPGPIPKFEVVAGLTGSVWALQQYQDQLLIANDAGVYRLGPTGAELLYKCDIANNFLLLPGSQPLLLVAELNGIALLKPDGQHWQAVGKIAGVDESINGMMRDANGVVWLSSRDKPLLLRLHAPDDHWVQGKIDIRRHEISTNLPDVGINWLADLQGQMRVMYRNSLYQLDEANNQLIPDPRFQQLFIQGDFSIVAVGNTADGQWLLAQQQSNQHLILGQTILQPDGSYRWQALQDTGSRAHSGLYREANGRFWLGTTELYQWDLTVPAASGVPFDLLLRKVLAADGHVLRHASAIGDPVLSLDYQQNKLRFEFAATSYLGQNQYAVWLDGVDKGWSEWSNEAFANYNSLWEGRYVLNVKARNAAGVEVQMDPLAFQIAPPWFRAPLMYLSYLLALFLLINRWYRWRTQRLRQEALALEHMVEKRTEQLSEAKIQVEHTVEELQHTLTSLKSTQRQLVRSEKMAALGQLVAGVAHEVNTPLGVALTGSSFLRESTEALASTLSTGQLRKQDLDNFLGSALESSQLIERNLHRAANLISNFKQVSVDRTSGDRRQFELKSFLVEVEQSLVTLWRQRPLQFTVACPAGIAMDSYPGTLSQVITILAQNSLLHAFAPDQAGQMWLIVRLLENETADQPAQIELTFADNGKGIPAADLDKVFEPFFTTKRAQGGTGLGLHILFNLVTERLGGTVYVETMQNGSSQHDGAQNGSSQKDGLASQQGCRFMLVLPMVAPKV